MPEWPDLHVLRGRIESALAGRSISAVRVGDPLTIRSARPLGEALTGRRLQAVRHQGKFLRFDFDAATSVVVNPMLSGLFDLVPAKTALRRTTALALTFDPDTDLRYRDDTRMGKVYLLAGDLGEETVPGLAGQGPGAGALPWSAEEFARWARATRREVRNLLMDQSFVAGIGNAYADEVLWAARLHPKRRVSSATAADLVRLYDALRRVLAEAAVAVEAGLPAELGTKVRDHLKVRGRAGEPCPRCGTRIVRTRHGRDDAFLCPSCQPPPRGQLR